MNNNLFLSKLKAQIESSNILIDYPLSEYTTFKVGGTADFFIMPSHVDEVKRIILLCKKYNFNYFIMGKGSNLIVKDNGFRGVIINTSKNLNGFSIKDNIILAKCGISLPKLANEAYKNSLSGLEFATGIPGTLGGAVVINAGAYISHMKDVIIETKYITLEGNIETINNKEHEFEYRNSIFKRNKGTVIESKIKLKKGKKEDIKALMDDFNRRRKEKQPINMPCAGSIFKRPTNNYAGKLIEEAGLIGYNIGDAYISDKHCGFIVNHGSATAKDIILLIKYIQDQVNQKFSIKLDTEVEIIGE